MRESTVHRRRLFGGACAGMFLFGIVLAVLGTLFGLPETRERLGSSLAQQGDIFLALYLGVFVSTLLTGPLFDNFGGKVVLAAAAAIVAVSLGGFSLARSVAMAAVAAFALGFGGGGLNTATNALVADLYPEERGAMLNYVAIFFGAGALLVPMLAAGLPRAGVAELLIGAAALATATTIAYLALPFPPPNQSSGFSIFASIAASRHGGVMLFALALFFQSGNESSLGGWISTYAGALAASPRDATWILAGYWCALMCGRLLGGSLVERVGKSRLVMISAIGSTAAAAILLFAPSPGMIAIGAASAGLSYAAIYPTILAMAADRYQRNAGTIFGFLFAAGLVGGMLFPWALGHIAQRASVRAGMALPLAGGVMISAFVIAIARKAPPAPRR